MASFAAVISLKHTIEGIKYMDLGFALGAQIKSANEQLDFLGNILRRWDGSRGSSINRSVINALDVGIREAVFKLQDVFDTYVFYHSLPPNSRSRLDSITPVDEKGTMQEIDLFLKTVKKLGDECMRAIHNPFPEEEEDDDVVSPIHNKFGGNGSTTIGLSGESEKIRNELLDGKPGQQTVSLLGMAGIGKTHLATQIYHHPLVVKHFDFKVWVRVGQKGHLQNIFVDIVAQVEDKPRTLYMGARIFELRELLKKSLHGRTYLIVLDDVWNTKFFDYLIQWLPADGNGRRILLTTRLEEVAKCHGISTIQKIRFLNNEESWNLLWQNVFADKSFPPQLEKSGRKIAEICEGLPLLILVVANILRGLDKTEEYWKKVAEKKTTTFTDAYDQISKVLSLSYDYLPQRLKVCFLYMGAFPQSCEIPAPKLINLWTVEDFLDPIEDLDLEEINYHEMGVPEWHYEGGFREQKQRSERFGMECLKGLVSHSLAIVCKQSSDNRIKSSKLHSAYWYMCIKEARKNKFFHVLIKLKDDSIDYMESQRRLSVQNNILFGIKEVYDSVAATLTARSLLCTGEDHQYPVPICLNLMLLKVLDALSIRFYEFPTEVVNLLQLRYLALTHNGKVPSSISKLQQLECLILRQHHNITLLRYSTCLPWEIWNLQKLKYLRITGSNLPSGVNLSNLLTLYVNANSCTRNVFRGTPSLKKLGIKIELQPDAEETLRCLEHVGFSKV